MVTEGWRTGKDGVFMGGPYLAPSLRRKWQYGERKRQG